MSDFVPGLEGVVAFETEIAEPDKEGGSLRYRGVDIEDLVGHVSFGNVWGLLVDGAFNPGLPPAEPFPIPVHSGDIRVDVQSALAMLAPVWGLKPLLDIDEATARDDLARAAVMALSYVAQSARGQGPADGAAERDRQGALGRRTLHDPLARRAGPEAREGGRRVLDVGGGARHERLDVHGPGHRLDGRGRRGRPVRRGGRDVGARCTAGPRPGSSA